MAELWFAIHGDEDAEAFSLRRGTNDFMAADGHAMPMTFFPDSEQGFFIPQIKLHDLEEDSAVSAANVVVKLVKERVIQCVGPRSETTTEEPRAAVFFIEKNVVASSATS